jgi:hypothetical protein
MFTVTAACMCLQPEVSDSPDGRPCLVPNTNPCSTSNSTPPAAAAAAAAEVPLPASAAAAAASLSVRQLKQLLMQRSVGIAGAVEKGDLVQLLVQHLQLS